MARKRLSMKRVREVLRLKEEGLSLRQIAAACGLTHPTVADYLRRAAAVGLAWPLPDGLDDEKLKGLLFGAPAAPAPERPIPDWVQLHRELGSKKGVTLRLLWQEYRLAEPRGYGYSRFCELYRAWRGRLDVVMRQSHRPGEKVFVDYAGQTAEVIDPGSGEIREVEVFVGTLGASNLTYAEATGTQGLEDWLGSHQRMFEYFGGVPEVLVPDNLRAGVTRAHRYDPEINPSYQELARHYGVAVVPARVRRPRDKSKVEVGVQGVERWVLAPLRHRQFFSLGELNTALAEQLERYNARPFQQLPGCRRSRFEQLERAALRPLPETPYELAQWKKARVHLDAHVAVEKHHYSVPHALLREEVDVRLTARVVEVFHQGRRVASHPRAYRPGGFTTLQAHLPEAHRQMAEWSVERLCRWGARFGPATERYIAAVIASRPHPQQALRACLGMLRLGESYDAARMEAACARAQKIGAFGYQSLASILKHGLDRQSLPEQPERSLPQNHTNLRGPDYYR